MFGTVFIMISPQSPEVSFRRKQSTGIIMSLYVIFPKFCPKFLKSQSYPDLPQNSTKYPAIESSKLFQNPATWMIFYFLTLNFTFFGKGFLLKIENKIFDYEPDVFCKIQGDFSTTKLTLFSLILFILNNIFYSSCTTIYNILYHERKHCRTNIL